MPKVDTTPQFLRPYLFHGMDLSDPNGSNQAVADCPFCGNEGKFYISADTGKGHCKPCGADTNVASFLQKYHELLSGRLGGGEDLVKSRRLLSLDTLEAWGVVKSSLTGEWLVPGYNVKGTLINLYRYVKVGDRRVLMSTPSVNQGLHGVPLFDPKKPEVWVCEGWGDGMAAWEILQRAKRGEDGTLKVTGNVSQSLLSTINVLATPGCNIWNPDWADLCAGRVVTLLYDNDHPRENQGKRFLAGYDGMKRVAEMLVSANEPPSEIRILAWEKPGHEGKVEPGYDPELPDKYDLRDVISRGSGKGGSVATLQERLVNLDWVLNRLKPIPETWAAGRTLEAKRTGSTQMKCVPCTSWESLRNQWRKAMKWGEGLDRALSVMLASVASTQMIGDQLWIRIISPPSCLDGDTPIYDPVDGTTKTVRERYETGLPFSVWTKSDKGLLSIGWAEPVYKYAIAPMYRVTFRCGKSIRVTGGHKFWNGNTYSTTFQLIERMKPDGYFLLPENHRGVRSIARVVSIEPDGEDHYYDFHVPGTENYWCLGLFHHNTGKTQLCDAIGVARKFVMGVGNFTGLHSGFQTDSDGTEDHSLLARIKDKTLVVKDADTLMRATNRDKILAQVRDAYDMTTAVSYGNKVKREYSNHRFTFILAGTEAMLEMDAAELGARFLDVIIMEGIDPDHEGQINLKNFYRIMENRGVLANCAAESHDDPAMILAKGMTGGYVEHLRQHANSMRAELNVDNADVIAESINRYAQFIAYMRARPSKKQFEAVTREMSARLVNQLAKLAFNLAVVLNRTSVDDEVMRRVKQTAQDTARGSTLNLAKRLYEVGTEGTPASSLTLFTDDNAAQVRRLLRFLRAIGAAESYVTPSRNGLKGSAHWRLTTRMTGLYETTMQ